MDSLSLPTYLGHAREAALLAGKLLKSHFNQKLNIDSEIDRDIKLEVDRLANDAILNYFKEHAPLEFLSEESPAEGNLYERDVPYWIIDPLDGSYNFFRGVPFCCTSIALWKGDQPLLGVIYDFNMDEMYTGIVGDKCYLNQNECHVSDMGKKSKAILTTGFPTKTDYSEQNLKKFFENSRQFKKTRMMGSAALDIAYVACGRFDYYHEKNINLWDVAAGIALVLAAGGAVNYELLDNEFQIEARAANKNLL